ncbi:hypothetical protein GGR53DRAFT_364603 [Hypoxylon sp. FL1150]|nr:hypothetical protein GGR53DRAFT_364603 [Hypoxylon sp. FL1150]
MAQENARDEGTKDQIIAKLKENGVLSDDQMTMFKHEVVFHDAPSQRETRSRQRELDERFDEFNDHTFISAVIEYIVNHTPNDRCTRVYEDVVSVIPDSDYSYTSMPTARPARDTKGLHQNPETPFSASKAAPGSAKSNAELIDILVSTANLESRQAVYIRGVITWLDSMYDATGGTLTASSGLVSGGRLGRDHRLSDVPNHYVRDTLMNYIVTRLEEDRREKVKTAVFPDLSAAELEEYSDIIMQKQREIDEKEQAEWDEARQAYLRREAQRNSEAANLERQDTLIKEIDKSIDLTPKPGFAVRNYSKSGQSRICWSVLKPPIDVPGPHQGDGMSMEPEERDVEVGEDIDRDCDQIRAMIARFIQDSGWSANQFRWALSRHITRRQLINFLEKRGPSAGKQTHVFPLAWEFFKKREMLGYPISNTPNDAGVLQERDANRRTKRPSVGERGNTREKRTRRT